MRRGERHSSIRLLRGLVVAAAVAAVGAPAPADGAELHAAGWWTSSPVSVAPDADDGLVVQAGLQPEEPTAYAAVSFALAAAEQPRRLTLSVAEGSASSPAALTVCPLIGEFAPVQGGAMEDAPDYDCTVSASAESDDGRYEFDVESLLSVDLFAVAVLPGAPMDRVVLDHPSSAALETVTVAQGADGDTLGAGDSWSGSTGSTSAPSSEPSSSTGGSGAAVAAPSSPPVTSSFAAPGPAAPTASEAEDEPEVTPPAESAGPTRAAQTAPAVAREEEDGAGGGVSAAPFLFVVLTAVAGGLWFTAGREPSDGDGGVDLSAA